MSYKKLEEKHNIIKGFLNTKNIYRQDYLDYINIKLTYNSNAIGCNTLSESQTAIIIEKGLTYEENFS